MRYATFSRYNILKFIIFSFIYHFEEISVTRILFFAALTFLIILPVSAQEFTAKQQVQIKKMFEDYLLENGAVVIKSVEKYQDIQEAESRKESELKAKDFLTSIKNDTDIPMTGNKDGDITLVEFFDYNCGYCSRALDEIVSVLEEDKNLKVLFFDMPILSPASLEASKWSLAAHKQGKYFEYHQAIFEKRGPKDDAVFEELGKNLDLDIKKLKKDKDSPEIDKILKNNIAQAQAMNIRGTPGFIINGQIFPGYMQSDKILEIIKEARTKETNKS